MKTATGEFVAIFDADFIPPSDFLTRTVHYFADPKVGVVQTRWSYLNRDFNFLTEVEAMLLDGHFILEHGARFGGGMFFNFNGTAGILRAKHDRRCGRLAARYAHRRFRPELSRATQGLALCLSAGAGLPFGAAGGDATDFQVQQSRWAKGLTQVAKKLLPVILRADSPVARESWRRSCTSRRISPTR